MKSRLSMQLISPNEVPAFDNLFPTGLVRFGSFYDLPSLKTTHMASENWRNWEVLKPRKTNMTTESKRLHTIGVDGISYQKLGVILQLVMFFCFRGVNPLFMTHNLSCFFRSEMWMWGPRLFLSDVHQLDGEKTEKKLRYTKTHQISGCKMLIGKL